jgi:hypothetical protein
MSDLKPPSQTTVGVAPATLRHASRSPSGRAKKPLVSAMTTS